MDKKELKSWLGQINKAQDRYQFELMMVFGNKATFDLWMGGEQVRTIELNTDHIESINELVDRLFAQTNAHRNFKFELKKRLAGLEKLTVWTSAEQSDVLREIADALLRHPELTVGMLRCIKTGHNVSLSKVDEAMKGRYKEGYYD